ncbi:PqiB family protein [Vibrio salinus]|uniref:PqiB family protein n=1 Tax=Vibrio salinus TaxID=2899784 RepID=UPI001E5F65BC|nr:MlaD family protein [Vibrio salinus]MCE0492564.1 MlaD family protein [Vibrio salinus]
MSKSEQNPPPQPEIKSSGTISPLWILPLVTLILTGWLVFRAINASGEIINIYFDDAQGLIAGRTPIRYQGLEVGMVNDIKLNKKTDSIYVEAEIYPEAQYLVNSHTQFWLVKPSASLSGVSGLDALVSGNYISLLPSNINDNSDIKDAYYALKNAPNISQNSHDLTVNLTSHDLGGINIGSKILYKKIPIGEVFGYHLAKDSQSVLIQASVKDEYKSLITDKSRFWNVSGISANINLNNIDIQLENLSSLLTGAISVDSPDSGKPIQSGHKFPLYKDIRSAGRGVHIQVELPKHHGLAERSSSVLFKDIKIGQVLDLELNPTKTKVIANIAIQPAFSDMLVNGSHFIIDKTKLSLSSIHKLPNLIKGNDLILIPNKSGKKQVRFFKAIGENQYNQQMNQSVIIKLSADNTYGLSEESMIRYRGIPVGAVTKVALKGDDVTIMAYVENKYKHLIKNHNKFYVNGSASAQLTDNGIDVSIPPPSDIFSGSISFISEGKPHISPSYQLYNNKASAKLARSDDNGSTRIELIAPALPPLRDNAPVLYHNIKVGRVENHVLTSTGVKVSLLIENHYKHLINSDTVFWGASGFEMDASLNGVRLKSKPLAAILKGGIEFDSIRGIENTTDHHYRLFNSLDEAKQHGTVITLLSSESHGIDKGSDLIFQGVKVGQVSSVTPDFRHQNVIISAYILPKYQGEIARAKSYFWFGNNKAGLVNAVKDIKNLIKPTIQVHPGTGKTKFRFTLYESPYKTPGLPLVLQSVNKNSVSVGMPITYRGIQVGEVTKVNLGDLADRVLIYINIESKYQYLVRENSIFWNETGVDMSVGLTGADIRTGSLQTLMTGSIAFNTPNTETLTPTAKPNDAYLLNQSKQPEWQTWNQPIPKP